MLNLFDYYASSSSSSSFSLSFVLLPRVYTGFTTFFFSEPLSLANAVSVKELSFWRRSGRCTSFSELFFGDDAFPLLLFLLKGNPLEPTWGSRSSPPFDFASLPFVLGSLERALAKSWPPSSDHYKSHNPCASVKILKWDLIENKLDYQWKWGGWASPSLAYTRNALFFLLSIIIFFIRPLGLCNSVW